MAKKFEIVEAAMFDFEKLEGIIQRFFKKHKIQVDSVEVAPDGWNMFSIFFYGGASHTHFNEEFSNFAEAEIMFGDEDAKNDRDNYYIVPFRDEKVLPILTVILGKTVIECFFREEDGRACVVFGK